MSQWHLSSLAALVTTTFALFSGGTLFGKLNSGSAVRIDLNQWAWITEVKVDLDHPAESTSPFFAQTDFVPASPSVSVPKVRVSSRKRLAPPSHFVSQRTQRIHQDQVAIATAAPLRVLPTVEVESEQIQMVQMHSLLRRHFSMAVASQFNPALMRVALAEVTPPVRLDVGIKPRVLKRVLQATLNEEQEMGFIASDLEEKLEVAGKKVDELLRMQSALFAALSPAVTTQTFSDLPSVSSFSNGYSSSKKIQPVAVKSVPSKPSLKGPLTSHSYSLTGVAPPYVEGFSQGTPVSGVKVQALTVEENGKGWKSYRAEGFWPTLARATSGSIPLLSENTVVSLAWAVGAKAQPGAGIVFGKIPSGWTVSFSGRSEQSLFFNSENKSISAAETDGVRQFAFSNAAPGAQMITLRGHEPMDRGIIHFPVVAGQATYLDLTQVSIHSISGLVLDADEDQPRPLVSAQVRLAGVSGEDVFSKSRGQFEIPRVAIVPDYPVYLETDFSAGLSEGYTHRYEVNSQNLDRIVLYRLGGNRLSTWLGQLEGGVSPESSLLVATATLEKDDLLKGAIRFPQVTSLSPHSSLVPETYTITGSGQLEVHAPLTLENPRFLSVQISEGPALAEWVNEDKKVLSSRLFFAQPGIINIVVQ